MSSIMKPYPPEVTQSVLEFLDEHPVTMTTQTEADRWLCTLALDGRSALVRMVRKAGEPAPSVELVVGRLVAAAKGLKASPTFSAWCFSESREVDADKLRAGYEAAAQQSAALTQLVGTDAVSRLIA